MPRIVADSIDQLISVEMRHATGLPRGVARPLYEAAREAQGGEPLVYLAAQRLLQEVSAGDVVLFVTGSGSRFGLHKGETDGPLGAASLGRALDIGIGARTVYICDEPHLCDEPHREPIRASVEAAGISVIDQERFEKRPHSAVIEIHPPEDGPGAGFAREVLDRYQPKAVVFIEKTGPNAKGVHHSITGTAKDPAETGHAYHLADQARADGIFTLGIGDGGNEIGNGVIYEAARAIQPQGKTCRCPCGDGAITVTPTDVFISAAVSNWGAYGVSAQMAYVLKNPELLQSEEMEDFMLRGCVAAGGTDGASATQVLAVDGTGAGVQRAVVRMLHEIVGNALKTVSRGF
jgi:hypothetical protein